jgi:hypothetical protein
MRQAACIADGTEDASALMKTLGTS